jgi:hypothetical protein
MMIDITHIEQEAMRLADLGVLDVTFKNGGGLNRTAKLVCIGYGVDGQENDFLLFVGPYGMRNKHMHRAITATDIIDIQVSETQSFDRYNMKGKKIRGRLGTPHGELDDIDELLREINDL